MAVPVAKAAKAKGEKTVGEYLACVIVHCMSAVPTGRSTPTA